MTYSDKLRDPRWQKKRLKILERDGWKCKYCESEDIELHVHHKKYKGLPHDADDEDLETLCKNCHYIFHFMKDNFSEFIGNFSTIKRLKSEINESYSLYVYMDSEIIALFNLVDNTLEYWHSFSKNYSMRLANIINDFYNG